MYLPVIRHLHMCIQQTNLLYQQTWIVSHTSSTTFVNYWTCIDVCKQLDDHCGNSASPFFGHLKFSSKWWQFAKLGIQYCIMNFEWRGSFNNHLLIIMFFFLSNSDLDIDHVTTSKQWAEMTDEMTHSTPLKNIIDEYHPCVQKSAS